MKYYKLRPTMEPAIKKRRRRALDRGAALAIRMGSRIVYLRDSVFDFEIVRSKEIRYVRMVLDKISAEDVRLVREFGELPGCCTKEIWCSTSGGKFLIEDVD